MKNVSQQLYTAVNGLLQSDTSAVSWNYKEKPGKWSKKEIIGHLIDSAQINLQRFIRYTYEENFKLIYEQVEWVEAQHYQDADTKELLELWRLLNLQIVRVWGNYPADRLGAKCDNAKITTELHTVEWLAQDYVDHLKQIL